MKRESRQGDFCLVSADGAVSDQTIAASPATATDGSEYVSKVLNVQNIDYLGVYLQATSAAGGASGNVTFAFLYAAEDNTLFEDTTNVHNQTLTLSGANSIKKYVQIDVRGIKFIKLYKISNGDAAGITGANAYYYGEEQD